MKKVKNVIEVSVLSLYPAILILDPKFANNIMIILFLFIIGLKIHDNKKIILTKYEFFLTIFVGSILISIWFKNITKNDDYTMLFRHLRWLILPTLIGQLDINYQKIKLMMISCGIGVLGYLIRLIQEVASIKPQTISIGDFLKSPILWNYRYMGNYSIPQTAIMMGVTSLIFYYSGIYIKNKKYLILTYMVSLLSFIILLSTQSRGMLLTFVIISFAMLIALKKKSIAILNIGVMILAISGILIFSNQRYIGRYQNLNRDTSILARIEIYNEAIRIFKENKLTGVGFEGFEKAQNPKEYKYTDYYWHPHNMALKMLSEMGIIGFVAYYLFSINIIIMLYKTRKRNKLSIAGLITIGSLLIYENIETMMIKAIALPYLFFILGICLNENYKIVEEKKFIEDNRKNRE